MTNENDKSLSGMLILLGVLIALLIPLLMATGIKHPLVIFIAIIWILNMGPKR